MSRKKKIGEMQDMPVDRIDIFLKSNFKKIILVSFTLVVVFLGAYGFKSYLAASRALSAEAIGIKELEGLFTKEQISSYADLADTYSFAKDYIHMTAAINYHRMGFISEAIDELGKVSGNYREFASSLKYDLGETQIISTDELKNGKFASLWNYRAALAADKTLVSVYVDDMYAYWPNSVLLRKLEDWGVQ